MIRTIKKEDYKEVKRLVKQIHEIRGKQVMIDSDVAYFLGMKQNI